MRITVSISILSVGVPVFTASAASAHRPMVVVLKQAVRGRSTSSCHVTARQ